MREAERLMRMISDQDEGKDIFEKLVYDPKTKKLKPIPKYDSAEGCIEMIPPDGLLGFGGTCHD